jgi:hypothetical protein
MTPSNRLSVKLSLLFQSDRVLPKPNRFMNEARAIVGTVEKDKE